MEEKRNPRGLHLGRICFLFSFSYIVAAVVFVDFLFFAVALPAEPDSGFMVFTHTVGVHACRALLRKQIINLLSSLLSFYRDPASDLVVASVYRFILTLRETQSR